MIKKFVLLLFVITLLVVVQTENIYAADIATPSATQSGSTTTPTPTPTTAATKAVLGDTTKLGSTGYDRDFTKWIIGALVGIFALLVGFKVTRNNGQQE